MSYRYRIYAAIAIVLGFIAIYPALRNAREIMFTVPGL